MKRPEQYAAAYAASHQKLIAAAFRRFSEETISATRLEDVAADAGLTLRMDTDEETMFLTTLHLMLAVVTRYAVGLVYRSGADPEQELLFQRDLLLQRFTTDAAKTVMIHHHTGKES
ncbi:MAG: hypothetical protein E7422_08665 [Ruminococcaceae bacterium]|nr:hypothetical protein [Oscillospiraceae bacterium]